MTAATFIDFEGRKGKPPALLGVLSRDAAGHERFTQLILDPALETARVARPHLRCSPLTVAAEALAADAERDDAPIVGWSLFDRDKILGQADVSPTTKEILERRYVNAIVIAKRWRRTYLPDWKPEANELKAYFPATGFKPNLRRGLAPEPASWIEHVQKQIAARGRYRQVTEKTKRDWHRLLVYNEDDCRGLAHVFDTATRELELWEAYKATTFVVETTPKPIDIRIGWRRRKLDRLLERHRVADWAFVSASNPAPNVLSPAENERRRRALIRQVDSARLPWLPGRGIRDGWSEESLLILRCSEAKAIALGRRFEQLAVVVGRRGAPARLVSCRRLP